MPEIKMPSNITLYKKYATEKQFGIMEDFTIQLEWYISKMGREEGIKELRRRINKLGTIIIAKRFNNIPNEVIIIPKFKAGKKISARDYVVWKNQTKKEIDFILNPIIVRREAKKKRKIKKGLSDAYLDKRIANNERASKGVLTQAIARANRKRGGGDGDPAIENLKKGGELWVRDSKCGLGTHKRLPAYGVVNTNTKSDGKTKDQTLTGALNLRPYSKRSSLSCTPLGAKKGTAEYENRLAKLRALREKAKNQLNLDTKTLKRRATQSSDLKKLRKRTQEVAKDLERQKISKTSLGKKRVTKSAVATANKKRRTAKK